MKLLDKYKEIMNSPDIVKYIGESKRRKFLVKGITAFVIIVLTLIAIILATVFAKVLFSYL